MTLGIAFAVYATIGVACGAYAVIGILADPQTKNLENDTPVERNTALTIGCILIFTAAFLFWWYVLGLRVVRMLKRAKKEHWE